MRKVLALFALISILVLAACGGGNNDNASSNNAGNNDGNAEEVTIKVGASSVPHAEILEEAAPILAEEGITLEIEPYEDYVLPNDDLASGDLDANYFQHIPYLEQTIEDTGYELTHIGGIHIEPIAAYSKSIDSIDNIKDGTEVVLSNSVADHGRVLQLFEANELITLKDGVEEGKAELDDIEDNPKNLTFSPDYEPAFLPEIYESEEDVLVVINTNYAIGAGLDPVNDSIFREGDDSPYVNVLAVQEGKEDDAALNKLLEVLRSEEIQDFMVENYDGAVVPVSE
ncbi:MetQ/NlpA family ABC transporter substrate-binding protein [Pseudogracilibacillus sp. SO10305]|uniref:MetQ/NlpA family ABC transporter substrate-binding protein n=1 Tax=Pseudogracilibacillus sp. SO10305 TaxID=3098292 RepID=UPI00300E1519